MLDRRQFIVRCVSTGAAVALARAPDLWGRILIADRRPLRVGIIGLGSYGRSQFARCDAAADVEVGALCDINEDVLRAVSSTFRAASRRPLLTATDYSSLLRQHDLDAVAISVPIQARAEIVDAACKAGKHVYVAPPWAASVRESTKVWRAASAVSGVVYQGSINAGWDSNALRDFIAGNHSELVQLHITLYRGEVERPDESLLDTIDQMELIHKLLGTELPSRVSVFRGVGPLGSTSGRIACAVCLDFAKADGHAFKRAVLQKAYVAGHTPEKVFAHIATVNKAGRHAEYVVAAAKDMPSKTAGGAGSDAGWGELLSRLRMPSTEQESLLKQVHYSNSYALLGEESLRRGSPVFYP